MRILDQADQVAERIGDRGDSDSFTHVLHRRHGSCTGRDKMLGSAFNLGDAPVRNTTAAASTGYGLIRIQPQLVTSDVEPT